MIQTPHYDLVPKDLDANLAFRRDLLSAAAHEPETRAKLRTMCAEDLLFYVNAFCWTYDPRTKQKKTPFVTYEFQDEAMLVMAEAIENGGDVGIAKSRDVGASWMGLTVIEWFWHFHEDVSFLLVSRNEDYVDKRGNPKALFWKLDFLHKNQPHWLLPTGRWLGDKDPGRKLLHMANADNGSVIDGESTTGDAGRGDRRTAMFIDEHAAFDLDNGFKVLRSTRDTTPCRIFNSTPQGSHNAFHEVIHETALKLLRLHWSKHPEKSRGLYTTDTKTGEVVLLDDWRGEVVVRRKGLEVVRVRFPEDYPFQLDKTDPKPRSPWYDNECARCVSSQEVAQELDIDFLGSDFPFFDPKFIEALKARYARPPLSVGDVEFDRDAHGTVYFKRFTENSKGLLKLWLTLDGEGRPARDRRFTMGVDVSAGTGASNSVLSVADRETGEKVAVLRTPNMRPHPFAELCMAVGFMFNTAYIVPDASGPTGKTFVKCLIAAGYGDIYYRRREDTITQEVTKNPGYYMNTQARASLLEDYRADLADHRFINRSESGLDECLQFIRRPDGGVEHSAAVKAQDPSGAKTAHGDEVVADALCCVGLAERRIVGSADPPKAPHGSLAWRRERVAAAERMAMADTLSEGW